METTRNSQAGQGAPEALVKALEALADGAINMKQAQAIVVRVIEANPAVSDNVQQFMMKKLSERAITAANYLELMAALERAVAAAAERTESSEDAPDQPGIYQVAHDGTIVFDDDELPEPEPEPETETEFPELDDTGSIYSPVNNIQGKEDVAEVPEEKQEIGVGTELRDRYRLEQEVARGSMGIVYKAVDLLKLETGARDPYVAIKLVGTEFTSHSTALKSFQNEIANTQHLSHPNIVNLFELDRDNDHYFITMEWLEGESLDALLDRSAGSALPPTQTYAIIEQLCDALIYAHERDVIHADIKPGNVFLVNTGEMKLIDWGIACIEAPVGDEQSNGGFAVALTPAYASCERLEKAPPTAQDDVYALGCMIYRLLAGRRVFGSMNALAAEKEAMQPVPIGGISDSRWSAIAKALAFRRKDRFVSVKEFAEEFGKRAASRSLKEALVEEDVAEPEVHEELQAVPEPESKANKIPEEVVPDDEPDLDLELSDELLEHLNNSSNLQALDGDTVAEMVPAEMDSGGPEAAKKLSALDRSLVERIDDKEEAFAFIDTANLVESDVNEALSGSFTDTVSQEEPLPFVDPIAADELPDIVAGSETPFVDTVNLGDDAAVSVGNGEESPYVDTVNLNEGAGFSAGDDPEVAHVDTVNLSEAPQPDQEPESDIAYVDTLSLEKSGLALEPDDSSDPDQAASAPAAPPTVEKQAEQAPATEKELRPQVASQLRGGGQRHVKETGTSRLAGLVAFAVKNPLLAAGSVLGVIVMVAVISLLLSPNTQQPLTAATSEIDQPVVDRFAADEAYIGMPVQVDLTVSGEVTKLNTVGEQQTVAEVTQPEATGAVSERDSAEVPVVAEKVTRTTVKDEDFFAAPVDVPIVESVSALSKVESGELAVAAGSGVQEADSAAGSSAGRREYHRELLDNARSALRQGRLVSPAGDNTSYWILRLREEGAPDSTIAQIESQLATRFIELAEAAYVRGDLVDANRQVNLAANHGAPEEELAALRSSISKLQR